MDDGVSYAYGQVDEWVLRLSIEPEGPSWVWREYEWRSFPFTAGEVRNLQGFSPLTEGELSRRGIIP